MLISPGNVTLTTMQANHLAGPLCGGLPVTSLSSAYSPELPQANATVGHQALNSYRPRAILAFNISERAIRRASFRLLAQRSAALKKASPTSRRDNPGQP